jgi:uncharacterized membrane protein
MNDDYNTPGELDFGETTTSSDNNNRNIWIIVSIVAVILLCCCCITVFGGVWLWNNGDQLIQDFSFVLPDVFALL